MLNVAGLNAGREQRQMQRAGSGVNRNAVLDAAIGRKLFFEGGHFRTPDKMPAFEHAPYRGVNLGFEFVILGGKIKEADHARWIK